MIRTYPVARRSSWQGPSRSGAAAIWAIVILFVLSVVLSMIVPQFMVNRRSVDHRHQQLQSLWLARAGIELAVGRLLTSRDARQNETVEVLPGGKVHITIQAEPNRTNT